MTIYIGWTIIIFFSYYARSFISWCRKIHAFVMLFHHLDDLYTPPRGSEQDNDQPGLNQELVSKQGTLYVAWTRVFKHCSLKKQQY